MQDRTNPVKVRWGYSYDQDNYNETEHKLSNNGLVELSFYPPVSNVTTLGIEVGKFTLIDVKKIMQNSINAYNIQLVNILYMELPVPKYKVKRYHFNNINCGKKRFSGTVLYVFPVFCKYFFCL